MKKNEKISVYLRIKPTDDKKCIHKKDIATVHVDVPNKFNEKFTFDEVFEEKTEQYDLFSKTTLPKVHDLFNGISSLIFAYGVTSSGKLKK
jgi:hypothetical protein